MTIDLWHKVEIAFTLTLLMTITSCTGNYKNTTDQSTADLRFEVDLKTVRSGYNPDTMWTQAYIASIPTSPPTMIVTMSQLLGSGIDNYGDLFYCISHDMGDSWTDPILLMQRTAVNDSMEMALSDVYPLFHEKTRKVLATGKLFYYLPANSEDPEVGRGVGYTIYDPATNKWSPLQILEMPIKDHSGATIYNPNAGCTQRYDLPNGEILLPIYYLRTNVSEGLNVSTIVRCTFDGEKLVYQEHGDEITNPEGRGFGETSIARYKNKYYITLRTNNSAYVTTGTDGLHYAPVKEWTFDDESILGSYNTQAHWATHSDGLFLIYTRKGANNDHVFRHRAPLFMAEVDPDNVEVIRSSEKIVVPEHGARLGNFGVTPVTQSITAISVTERMTETSAKYGSDNRLFVSKIIWHKANKLVD